MSIQDLVDAKTTEALKVDQKEQDKFNDQAKEQSNQLTKGFQELINDTAKLTSGNTNDDAYTPNSSQSADNIYELAAVKMTNEENDGNMATDSQDYKNHLMKKEA